MRWPGRLGATLVGLSIAACGPELPPAGSGVKLPALGPSTFPQGNPSAHGGSLAPSPGPSLAPSPPAPSPSRPAAPSPSPGTLPSPGASGSANPASPSPGFSPSPGQVALGLVPASPRSGWRVGPELRRSRFGLGAGVLEGQLVALEGDQRPGLERLNPEGLWELEEAYGPQGSGKLPWGWRFMAVGVREGGVALVGGERAGPTPESVTYDLGGPVEVARNLSAPLVGAAGGATAGLMLMAGGESPRTEALSAQVWAIPWGAQGPLGEPQARAQMPHAVAGAASAMVEGKLWVLGGYERADAGATPVPTAHVQVYDPTLDRWLADGMASGPPPLPAPRQGGAALHLAGELWLVGGAGTGGGLVPEVVALAPGAQAWRNGPSLPTPRTLLALAAWHGEAWAIGGVGAKGQPLRTVEVLRP